jgi:hypothetical protein
MVRARAPRSTLTQARLALNGRKKRQVADRDRSPLARADDAARRIEAHAVKLVQGLRARGAGTDGDALHGRPSPPPSPPPRGQAAVDPQSGRRALLLPFVERVAAEMSAAVQMVRARAVQLRPCCPSRCSPQLCRRKASSCQLG